MTRQDPLAEAALRAGSAEARDPLARAAGPDPWLRGELARVIALQNLRPGDRAEARALLAGLPERDPAHHGLYAQLVFEAGDHELTRALLAGCPASVREGLEADLTHGTDEWTFPALLPAPTVRIAPGSGTPFDRLTTGYAPRVGDRSRITTIVTTYRPGPGLLTAVRSLAAQTWTNHEILVVDDGSPHGHDDVLRRAAALDPRVRVLRLAVNGGTYVARNHALALATGDYVTFQDSDDWSHPLRLERQVAPLRSDPAIFSTTSAGIRVTEDLRVSRVGFPHVRSYNLSSLMIRREVALARLGGLDPVRKGADAEYVERARAVFGRPATHHLGGEPLALIRLSTDSLSSADYRPGWMHPARRSYLSAFQAWHRHVKAGSADPRATRSFAAPRRLTGQTGRRVYDVVVAADWTAPDAGLGQVRALRDRGLRVAVLHLDDPAGLRHGLAGFDPVVQDAINAGQVDQIELCDDVRARLVLARDPAVLRFPPAGPSAVRTDRVVIEARTAAYPRRCVGAARRLFGADPLWAPPGPAGRTALASTPGGLALTDLDLPGTVDPDGWRLDRRGPRGNRPVAGRQCAGGRDEWRRLRAELPDPARVDIRLLDGGGTAARAFGRSGPPRGWLVYDGGDLSLRNFLYQVDFYLHLPAGDAVTDAEPAVLAALAAGCVVVLPPRYEATFGDAAVYGGPAELADRIRALHGRRAQLTRQSECGREYVRARHGHDRYAERVLALLS